MRLQIISGVNTVFVLNAEKVTRMTIMMMEVALLHVLVIVIGLRGIKFRQ